MVNHQQGSSMAEDLGLESQGPSITTSGGFTIQVDHCGGFALLTPDGPAFAWAQTIDEADAKVARERREHLFTRRNTP